MVSIMAPPFFVSRSLWWSVFYIPVVTLKYAAKVSKKLETAAKNFIDGITRATKKAIAVEGIAFFVLTAGGLP
jgi:hypothetical protein